MLFTLTLSLSLRGRGGRKGGRKEVMSKRCLSRVCYSRGITFISVLVAFFILAVGIITILRVYPAIDNLSGRAKNYVSVSMIADRIFAVIENIYGSADGPAVPSFIEGVDEEFAEYGYSVWFEEEKQDLYRADMEILFKKEGKNETEYFQETFRRK